MGRVSDLCARNWRMGPRWLETVDAVGRGEEGLNRVRDWER